MKRKLFIFISMILLSSALSAKPANVVYYILSQTAESICDNSILSVEFNIECPLIYTQEAGYVHPQPHISLILTNKSDKAITLNLNASKLIRNSHVESFDSFSQQKDIVIAPHASISFDQMKLFTEEARAAFYNMYHFKHLKVLNNDYGMLCFGQLDKTLEPGAVISYAQSNTPIYIATAVIYSVDGAQYEMRTEYFAEKKIGSALNGMATEKEEIINNAYPDWVNPKHEVIKLWCLKER